MPSFSIGKVSSLVRIDSTWPPVCTKPSAHCTGHGDENSLRKISIQLRRSWGSLITSLRCVRRSMRLDTTSNAQNSCANQPRPGAGTNRRNIVDTESIVLRPRPQRNEILGERQAAAWIGIPVSVLERLRDLGQFPMRHHLSFRYGYHRPDLMAFRNRLIDRSRQSHRRLYPIR